MQKWEYLTPRVSPDSNWVMVMFVDGKRLTPTPLMLEDWLTMQGIQGWEMIAFTSMDKNQERYIFKRPKK